MFLCVFLSDLCASAVNAFSLLVAAVRLRCVLCVSVVNLLFVFHIRRVFLTAGFQPRLAFITRNVSRWSRNSGHCGAVTPSILTMVELAGGVIGAGTINRETAKLFPFENENLLYRQCAQHLVSARKLGWL